MESLETLPKQNDELDEGPWSVAVKSQAAAPQPLLKIGQQRKKKKRVRNLQIFLCKTILYYVIRSE